MKKVLLLSFIVVLFASLGLAAEEQAKAAVQTAVQTQIQSATELEKYPNIKIGGQTFFDYRYSRNAGANSNAFEINRAFLKVYGDLLKNWSYKLVLDMAPLFNLVNESINVSGTDYGIVNNDAGAVHVAKAYLAYDLKGHVFYGGIIDTVWEEWAQKNAWMHTRIAYSPLGDNGYWTNSIWDLGVAVKGVTPCKKFEYHVGIYNGEGYRDLEELSNGKSVQGRFTFMPFDWISLSTGLQYNRINEAMGDVFVVPTVLTLDMGKVFKDAVYFSYMRADGRNAFMISYVSNMYLMESKLNPFFRFDYGIKNNTIVNGPTLAKNDIKIYTGLGYKFNDYVTIDGAFIYMKDDSAADKDTYAFGPFAEVKF